MSHSTLEQRSSSSGSSETDSEYETDLTRLSLEGSDDDVQMKEIHPRPPEYYTAHAEEVNRSDVIKRIDYADSTTKQLNKIAEQWREYCDFLEKDPSDKLNSITVGDVDSFFRWKLDKKQNIDRRWLRGTKESSSLGTYWKQFLLEYKRATGKDTGGQIIRQMHTDYGLSNHPRQKSLMDVRDVTEHVQIILTTTEKMFKTFLGPKAPYALWLQFARASAKAGKD
ncbi:hypothetical protein K469DRAFT_685224 [Zopfia rhizophila CBS 207.26]|uniref:Uncharacterized protein n=1 Tax=Zopfia rhizophila CBS 207.26 TaxID=1314779 RepID=A0A6A6D653_9PEZI|nr:hypothetical protein K469DRAFT_685224 [Zopfia rhizophila CBS 207.26]